MHPLLWLGLASLTGIRVIADWPLSDNHAYLLSYWCLACGLAGLSDNPQRYLARNARWLIGLAFAWALLWKLLLSGDYSNGVFFRVTMLTDPPAWKLQAQYNGGGVVRQKVLITVVARSLFRQWRVFINGDISSCGGSQ